MGSATALLARMGCTTGADNQQAPRSMHNGGVNVGMADGSTRFINDSIQLGTYFDPTNPPAPPLPLGVWDKLLLSNDGLPIDASQL